MAHEQGVSVGDVAESGPGLAFIAYPKAVAQMPFAPFWSVLFFIMIILLGLDSQFVGVEGLVTALVDQFPHALRKGHRKELFIGCVCVLSFLIGLPMVTNGGMYIFQLFDYYSGSRIILVVAFFECLVVAWIYGVNRFYDNLHVMLGYKMPILMKYFWMFITPTFTIVMFSMCIYSYSELTYNRTYLYPRWAIVFGWMLACSSVVFIPGVALWKLCRAKGTFKERMIHLTTPKLKPHQLVHPDSLINDVLSINPDLAEVKQADQIERVPLNDQDGASTMNGYKMPPPADENTQMLSPEDVQTPCEDTSVNMTCTQRKPATSNNGASNNHSNSNNGNGPAAV